MEESNIKKDRMVLIVTKTDDNRLILEQFGTDLLPHLKLDLLRDIEKEMESRVR